jgi:bifunctional non-homologous end joining protein LigD
VGGPATEAAIIEVGGRAVRFTNPSKVLWPASGTTKGDLLDYYRSVAPVLLPHIARRPMTLGRWPDGTGELGWLQTTCPHPPGWIPTHRAPPRRGTGPGRNYCLVNDEAALVWAVNLATVEFHPLLARVPDTGRPDQLLFDLDPGEGVSIAACCAVALRLRAALATDGLEAFPKTSGQAGLHLVVPLRPGPGYAATKSYVRALAGRLAAAEPDLVVDRMDRTLRQRKVFIDWSQNDERKSTVAPYSLRATPWPLVSTPLRWSEVEDGAAGRRSLLFDRAAVLRRLDEAGDIFESVLRSAQDLPAT